jgi:PEP-CTERM motif
MADSHNAGGYFNSTSPTELVSLMNTRSLKKLMASLAGFGLLLIGGLQPATALPVNTTMFFTFTAGAPGSLTFDFDDPDDQGSTLPYPLTSFSWTDLYGNPLGLADVIGFEARINAGNSLTYFSLQVGGGDVILDDEGNEFLTEMAIFSYDESSGDAPTVFQSIDPLGPAECAPASSDIGIPCDRQADIEGVNSDTRPIDDPNPSVPEPGTLALVGLALLGMRKLGKR